MALLDNLLGGNGGLLGGLGGSDSAQQSSESSESSTQIGTNPGFGLQLQDVLHSESSDNGFGSGDESGGEHSSFTGIGSLGVGFSAPTFVGTSQSSESDNTSIQDGQNGGLLGGLI